jgi:hypothetical protein
MSTKTTFKRIALVAVAALGFGTLSVVPSHAAVVYSSSAATGTYGKATANPGVITSFVVTATGDAAGDTAGTIYWTKTTGVANNSIRAQLTSSLTTAGTTVSTQATSGADSGTITWIAPGIGSSQVRIDYVAQSTAEGSITFCYAALVAGACTTASTLMTLTESSSSISVGAAAAVSSRAPWMVNIPSANASTSYASATSITVTQTASAGGYVELKSVFEDIPGDNGAPNTSLITVDGGTFHSTTTTAAYVYNNAVIGSATSATIPAGTLAGDLVRIATPAVGTITVKYITRAVDSSGVSVDTTRQTVVINATTAPNLFSYATSAMIANNTGFVAGDDVLYAPSAAGLQVATVTVSQFSALNTPALAANAKAITATLTGVGSLASATGGAATTYIAIPAATSASYAVNIFGTGVAGTGTLVIAVNGVNIKTHTLKFYGAAAKVEVAASYTIGRAGGFLQGSLDSDPNTAANVSVGGLVTIATVTPDALNDPSLAVLVTDALGTPVPSTVSVTSSNPAVVLPLTSANSFVDSGDGIYSAGTWYRHYTYNTATESVSGQSSTLTFSVALAGGLSVSATQVVTIGGVPSTETLKFDKDTYSPGEAMVITRTAKDSAGNNVFDNATANGVIFNKAVGGSLGESFYVGGVAYSTQATRPSVFAPSVAGAFEARMTGKVAGATSAIVAKATVSDDAATAASTAAADAAAEATDAANAATDAANAAAEAADAATAAAQDAADAVAALSTQVAEMVAALKKQITSLTNLVIKIQKKVKA